MTTSSTIIVGAGPAGLATAACLTEQGQEYRLLEANESVGSSWRGHYERLHLHTARDLSALPMLPFPEEYPAYPARQQVVDYLEDYRRHFAIEVELGVRVERASHEAGRWVLETSDGPASSDSLVVATGYNGRPHRPRFDGEEEFEGSIVHSSDYFTGSDYAGRDVLVVGAGNSGAEIAVDLWECGARPSICIRGPVHVQPRDFMGIPVQQFGIMLSRLPRKVADAAGLSISKMLYSDLDRYGIRRPEKGPVSLLVEDGRVPLIDIGTIDLIRQGALQVAPGIRRFHPDEIEFVDDRRIGFDDVVLATGYRPGLDEWLDPDGVLDERGLPTRYAEDAPMPGLHFVGFRNPPTGQLHDIALEAPRVAAHIAARS